MFEKALFLHMSFLGNAGSLVALIKTAKIAKITFRLILPNHRITVSGNKPVNFHLNQYKPFHCVVNTKYDVMYLNLQF
jgi:biotin synthase-like enzyme